jgi:SRSO17 transposase
LLGRADWNPDVLRDRLRTYLTDYLADPDAVGVIDETGFLKKGRHSAGVARQYSGTAGKIENCQIGVFLTYASCHGHTLLDRELYLPQEWLGDRERCQAASIPDEREFATKPALARQMLQRTFEADVTLAWVAGDSVYGDDRALPSWLEQREQAYVLAVSGKEHVWLNQVQQQVKTILAELPIEGWERHSAGAGSKGPRVYEWRRLELSAPAQQGWKHFLLVRRSISDPNEMTGYSVFARADTTLSELVQVAGKRWTVEESIECAKGEVGLDQYEVRSWTGWYRHITLAMWASAFLSVIREESGAEMAPKKGQPRHRARSSMAAFKATRGLQSG